MDHDIYKNAQPPSHYERVVLKETNRNAMIQQVKQNAFRYMNQLEGWCTHNKASILIDFIFMLEPKNVVEIGVFGGKSLIPMATALRATGKGKIYGIDPWDSKESCSGMQGEHLDWWKTIDHLKILQGLQTKMVEFGLMDQIELIMTSSERAPPIHDIDILHLDGNHSKKAAEIDVNKWVPLVRQGGLIIFDDTDWGANRSAVDWLDENCTKLAEFKESNTWGIWIKR